MTTQSNLIGTGTPALRAQAMVGLFSNNLTALGASQGTALALPSDFNVVTTAAASTGAILPICGSTGNAVQPPDSITVINHGANPLTVYPPVGGKVANGATNAGLAIPATKTAVFNCVGVLLYSVALSV